jgi:GAF domain-containing protein
MADHSTLDQALRRFAATLPSTYDVVEVLTEVGEAVTEMTGVTGTGVSLDDARGTLRFVTASTEEIIDLEHTQESEAQGPCIDAFTTGLVVTAEDLEDDLRWARFGAAALNGGFRAVAGIPMTTGERTIGALNLYDRKPREWDDDTLDDVRVLADVATTYVAFAQRLAHAEELTAQLQHALDSRVVIEQAKGLIAGERGISLEEALQVLRRHARSTGARLHDVAHAAVELGLRPPR